MADVTLRRELAEGETLVQCSRCGHVDIPLNGAETWHYCRTGEGLGSQCSKHLMGWHDWKRIQREDAPRVYERYL